MRLVVGLGNPGKEYENTRHNIGFFMIDHYINYKNISGWKSKFNGLYLECNLFDEKVIFLKPQSYMNLSGEVILKFVNFYKIPISDILIISDDLDLSTGNFKLKDKGSSGGHNGLKNIEKNLGTQEYKRLKIGISNNTNVDTKDHVLGKFSTEELEVYSKMYPILEDVMDDFFSLDFLELMNKYNRKNRWLYGMF